MQERSERKHAGGCLRGAVQQFRGRCGSTLVRWGNASDSIGIFLGTPDNPSAMPPPEYQIWTARRAPWLPEMTGILLCPGSRTTRAEGG